MERLVCQECVRLQNIVDEQACEIAKLVLRAKADEESRKKVDDITENMNDLIV